MAEEVDLKEKIYEMVAKSSKKLKPGDIAKKLSQELGVEKSQVKTAIKEMVSEGRLIFTYYGSSYGGGAEA